MRPTTPGRGGPEEVVVGTRVVWRHSPRGGYGFVVKVPAIVLRFTGRRVVMSIASIGGEVVERVVRFESLRSAVSEVGGCQ